MTHADRVRHKTDEELATLFTKIMAGNSGAQLDGIWQEKGMEENQRYFIKLNWLDWLKQEETPMSKEEKLFEAVRTIKSYCKCFPCSDECKIFAYCGSDGYFGKISPRFWPDPEKGGGENG